MRKYTEDHEWVLVDGDIATVGISDHAQSALGDIVFVELPEKGVSFSKGDDAAVVESVKAASEIYAPLSGEIVEVNEELDADPAKVNSAPLDGGWFFKIKVSETSELDSMMDEAAYTEFLAGLE